MKKKAIVSAFIAGLILLATACSENPDRKADVTEQSAADAASVSTSGIITLADMDDSPVFSEIDESNSIVLTAQALIGTPFAEGGKDPSGFDNSGFIYYVLRENGYVNCPRITCDQVNMGEQISYLDMKSGDLVFFSDEEASETANFGGIYIGGGIMVYSSMPGDYVVEKDISESYWIKRFVTAVSLS